MNQSTSSMNAGRAAANLGEARSDRSRDAVVLIHGMLAGERSMRRIGEVLKIAGYRIVHWNYPTMRRSLCVHGDKLTATIRDLLHQQEFRHLHFAAHSMGCIVLRLALQAITPPAGSRVVMLAPPNSGSRLTRLPMGPLAVWFPHLPELSEAPGSLVNQLAEPVGVEVGVMAASRDCVVDIDRTHLATQQDHVIVATTHQRLISHPEAISQVRYFLEHGKFERNESTVNRHAA